MNKVYIIIKGAGEYSDRYTMPVKAYCDQATAVAIMAKLDAIEERYSKQVWRGPPSFGRDYALSDKLNPEATAEYAALGFEADIYNDWELAEAELVGASQ